MYNMTKRMNDISIMHLQEQSTSGLPDVIRISKKFPINNSYNCQVTTHIHNSTRGKKHKQQQEEARINQRSQLA